MIEDTAEQHTRQIDAQVNAFRESLDRSLGHAGSQILAEMASKLEIRNGVIVETSANQAALRTIGTVIDGELGRAGYDRIINGFVNSFPGQIPWFQSILAELTAADPIAVKFRAKDVAYFSQRQATTVSILQDEINRGILAAKQKALFSVAGMPLRELVTEISNSLQVSVSSATALADTALPGFYRTVANRGYDIIEQGLAPGKAAYYTYFGPRDVLNRPFCKKLMVAAKSGQQWTRGQIANMDNGPKQPKPVIIYCGGWRCRHQFGIKGVR